MLRLSSKIVPQGGDDDDDVGAIMRAIDRDMESFAVTAPSSSVGAAAVATVATSGGGGASTTSATRRKSLTNSDGGSNNNSNRRNSFDNNNSSDENEKEIKFTHEIDDFAVVTAQATEELKKQFGSLREQLDEYKARYNKAADKLQVSENAKRELEDRVDMLEEELQAGGGGSAGRGFASAVDASQSGERRATTDDKVRDKLASSLRRALDNDVEEDIEVSFDKLHDTNSLFNRLNKYFVEHLLPFKHDIKVIESRFGQSVACYFVFYRFIFLQMCLVGAIVAFFNVLHISYMADRGGTAASVVENSGGVLPTFMLYSSYDTDEAIIYVIMLVVISALILVSIIEKIVREDYKGKEQDAFEGLNTSKYAKEAFCVWDNSLSQVEEAANLKGSLLNQFTDLLESISLLERKRARRPYDRFLLYSRRVLVFFVYLGLQASSFYAITYLTTNADAVASALTSSYSSLSSVSAFVAPIAVNLINTASPHIINFITKFEKWDSGNVEINIALVRQYLSSMFNLIILVASYFLLADPLFLANYPTIRAQFDLAFDSSSYSCRMDQAAQSLFTLVLTGFSLKIAAPITINTIKHIVSYITKKPFFRAEFNMPRSTAYLLDFMGMIFLSIPFAPLAVVFVPLFIFIKFKMEILIAFAFFQKPQKPWKSQKAGEIFGTFYLMSCLILGCSAQAFYFSSQTFAKSCSIQDSLPALCSGSISSSANNCTLDTGGDYYTWVSANYDTTEYPYAICRYACGPMVDWSYNLEPLRSEIYNWTVLRYIWQALFGFPYLPWGAFIVVCVIFATSRNSFLVNFNYGVRRQSEMETHIEILNAERRRNEKTINKLKALQKGGEDTDGSNPNPNVVPILEE